MMMSDAGNCEFIHTRPTTVQLRQFQPEHPLKWYDYAELWLESTLGHVLDYGCGDGSFLARIAKRCVTRTGVDIDPEKIKKASCGTGIRAIHIRPGEPLPFEDGTFNTVVFQEVIEHVADERAILAELTRVLAPGGILLLTTPHRGLLTFLDPGNLKFAMPRFHRFIHVTLLRRKEYYEERFGAGRKSGLGMIADFTTDQEAWHRHYFYGQIRALAPRELETLGWAVYYPAFRAMWSFSLVLKVLTLGRLKGLPFPFRQLDNQFSRMETRLGDQLLVLFRKVNE